MRSQDVLLATAVAVLVISAFCIVFYPRVQDFMVGNSLWNGLAGFSGEYKASCLDSATQLPRLPQGKVLLSIPYLSYTEEELTELKRFVTRGGRLILMDDYGQGNEVLEYLGLQMRFSGKPLLDPLFCYKNPRLPRITDFAPGVRKAGVKSVVFNHATILTNMGAGEVLAWSSDRSFLDLNGDEKWSPAEPKGPFPVAAKLKVGKGEFLLVSDPSILINSMIGKDNNRSFLEYLMGYNIEPGGLLVDRAHLEKTPLDESKLKLARAREIFSHPLPAMGLLALIFGGVARYLLWSKGGKID